jgi:hypothetical protein
VTAWKPGDPVDAPCRDGDDVACLLCVRARALALDARLKRAGELAISARHFLDADTRANMEHLATPTDLRCVNRELLRLEMRCADKRNAMRAALAKWEERKP